ncbi:glucokinase [Evansella caseinilytica]|uniref:Glucokinase n=1 Tax=Evansella caseinilytica TaxID=1503961 RepID=A0A1H3KRW1_9BACI|nr:ROK family glucokinase [Evansella caseinilytica]SDY54538.1 glucokinase [Evansella caseinilytica]
MEKNLLAGIDIGGTTVKLSFIDVQGNILTKWEIPTNIADGGKHIVKDIAATIEEKLAELGLNKSHLMGIGIGAPGFIDVKNGIIFEAVNIGWKDFHLKEEIETLLAVPAFVDNDANLAAVGEMWQGAGKGAKNLICVTLGTGVGGGIIADGEIIHGQSGMAGEIGHIAAVTENGAPCNCGKTGCLETVASATGISRLALEALDKNNTGKLTDILAQHGKLSTKDVFTAAQENDAVALSVIDEATRHLGLVLANLANAINPETIVIGGGVSRAGDYLVHHIRRYFNRFAIPKIANETKMHIATLGNDAGVYGAAWLAKSKAMK